MYVISQCTLNAEQASAGRARNGHRPPKLNVTGITRLILNFEKFCTYEERARSVSTASASRPPHALEKLCRTSLVDTLDWENSVKKSSPMSRISFCESCTCITNGAVVMFRCVTDPST